jgi:hypothetical protein
MLDLAFVTEVVGVQSGISGFIHSTVLYPVVLANTVIS